MNTRLHRISSSRLIEVGASSKLNGEWESLSTLYEEARRDVVALMRFSWGTLTIPAIDRPFHYTTCSIRS
jgi:hypothetical protein